MRNSLSLIALCCLSSLAGAQDHQATVESVTLRGTAQKLTDVLAGEKLKVDEAPIADQVVLRTESGEVVPLLSDPGSRALFLDERLRDQPLEVQGRRFEGLPYLQVTLFKIRDGSAYRVPEYYCDICTISVRYPQVCPCCQGDMELRMQPEAP